MPLPSVINGAAQCTVNCKRTGIRCKNPAAFGCKSCRMHGAHKSRNTLQGANHPQYSHGEATKKARAKYSEKSSRLLYLRDIGDHIDMFTGSHTRGRKPMGYIKLDLDNPEQMALAIFKTSKDKLI